MKEIPLRYVKANQTGIVAFAIIGLALQQPWIIAALWVIQIVGLLTEGRLNPFVAMAKRLFPVKGEFETQAVVLQRFNNTLAILFLTISLILFAVGWQAAGIVVSLMLVGAAGTALLGYCIGCTIYFQYKQLLARRRLSNS
jgi:hypothetical protein